MAKRSAKKDCSGPAKSSRFDFSITDDDFEDLQAGYQPKTTIRNTEWSVKLFNSWVEDRNSAFPEKVPTDLLEGKDLSSLGNWLGRFVVEVRRQDGKHYPPKTLQLLLFGLQRHLNSALSTEVNFMRDPEFHDLRKILDSYYRKLHQEGVGCSSKSTELLTREDEEKLWQSGVLNPDTPQGLLNCVFFLNGKNFCLRGGQEHRELKLSQLKRDVVSLQGSMKVCYTYTEHGSKNRSGGLKQLKMENKIVRQYESENTERCHVLLLDKYIQKLPAEAKQKDLFYMKPKSAAPNDSLAPWFYSIPVGKNTLGNMMKTMSRDAGLGKGVTNHSLRAYGATELFRSNVPEKLVQQRTGHRSLDALRKYERIAEEQVMDVCRVLDGTKPQQENQGNAIPLKPQVVLPVKQPSPMLQQQQPWPQSYTMPQPAPIPQLSGCTLSNCIININTQQPQPPLQEDYSNIDINEFLNF